LHLIVPPSDLSKISKENTILDIFSKKKIWMGEGVTPPQHHFSQKDVRKCIISESLVPELFKISKNIKIDPITVEKKQNEVRKIFFLQI